jgi:hypothetical protein
MIMISYPLLDLVQVTDTEHEREAGEAALPQQWMR